MREPRWVPRRAIEVIHQEQLEEHGGLPGIRDDSALESALGRPRNKWAYSKTSSMAVLAAAYGFGIARNHSFHDGNKRTAFLAMAAFLGLNGYEIETSEADVVTTIVALAAGEMSEARLATWVGKTMIKRKRGSS